MRTLIIVVSVVLSGPSVADSVRHLSVPERFWGTWAPSPDLCRDKNLRKRLRHVGGELCGSMAHRNRGRQRADLLCPHALHQPHRAG
jgi:hypothetical protein